MDTIENLGLYLKNMREEKKIPIAQIAQELKTKLEIVQAIEANEFGKLPAPTYVKGFLRSYAKYLGIDSDQLIAEYNRQYPDKSEQVIILQGKKLPVVGIKIDKKIVLAGVSVIVALLGITFLSIAITRSIKHRKTRPAKIEKKEIKPIPSQKPAEELSLLVNTSTVKEEVKEQAIPKEPETKSLTTPVALPIELTAKSLESVWMRVFADGKLLFEGILAKDEEKKWKAEKEFKLRIGNPSNLSLTVNGQSVGQIVPYGGPVNAVINENGVKAEK